MMKTALNIGCGSDIRLTTDNERWTNVDHISLPGVDVVIDLNRYPWPLPDDAYDLILCRDVLEHIFDFVAAMAEIHRILKKDSGVCEIRVPYYGGIAHYSDPTHVRGFTEYSLDYFIDGGKYSRYNFYSNARFTIDEVRFLTYGPRRYIPLKRFLRYFFRNVTDVIEWKVRARSTEIHS